MKTYRVRMTDAYGWTAGQASPDAPNQSAVLTVEDNGTRWISQVNVDHLSLNELADLVDFCKRLPG